MLETEAILQTPDYGLLIYQIVLIIFFITILYFMIKLYKKIITYLDLKTKYLKKKIERE